MTVTGTVLGYVIARRKELTTGEKAFGCLIAALPWHMFEERIFPGGFGYIFADNLEVVGPMVCNVVVIVFLIILFIKKRNKVWISYVTCILCFGETAIHTFLAIKSYGLFHDAGLSVPYSPGYFVCIFMLIPIFIITLRYVIKNRLFDVKELGKAFLCFFLIAVCGIIAPTRLIKCPQYQAEDRGLYEKYIAEETEQ